MEQVSRVWFTPQQKAELWERWKSGQCIAAIVRTLGRRNKSGVYRVLALNGGIVPTPRRRAAGALRLEEREEISRGLAAGQSLRHIACGLERAPSTVSREVRHNGGSKGYRATSMPVGRVGVVDDLAQHTARRRACANSMTLRTTR